MKLRLFDKVRFHTGFCKRTGHAAIVNPVFSDLKRFSYGPFRFKTTVDKNVAFGIQASKDFQNWDVIAEGEGTGQAMEYIDSLAPKYSSRFYRPIVGATPSNDIIGYVTVTLPPGFSLIANPFESAGNAVADLFRDWPEGTALSKFDTRLFKLGENKRSARAWSNLGEKLTPGEGAIFYNPTNDYKSHSFCGKVILDQSAVPIPSGFSLRSSPVPQGGLLADDLGFPISDGDVIHLFDRDQQKYVLYPFEKGAWVTGQPILSLGESFWVAKNEAGSWTHPLMVEDKKHQTEND